MDSVSSRDTFQNGVSLLGVLFHDVVHPAGCRCCSMAWRSGRNDPEEGPFELLNGVVEIFNQVGV